MKQFRQLLFDALGILVILLSPFVGFIPGPGGLFVFLAGLWLLARNHTWAQQWLDRIKEKSLNLVDIMFINHPLVKALYDIIALGLLSISIYIFNTSFSEYPLTLASLLTILGISLFLGNRRRINRLHGALRKMSKK